MCSPRPDDLKADGGFKRNNTKAAMPGRLLRAGVVAGQRRRCQRWQTALKLCSFTLIIVQSISVLPQDAQACTLLTTPPSISSGSSAKPQPQTLSEICSVWALPQLYQCYFCPSSPYREHKQHLGATKGQLSLSGGSNRVLHAALAQLTQAGILINH